MLVTLVMYSTVQVTHGYMTYDLWLHVALPVIALKQKLCSLLHGFNIIFSLIGKPLLYSVRMYRNMGDHGVPAVFCMCLSSPVYTEVCICVPLLLQESREYYP